ncbi:MAG: 4-(cytidine 5'-diphospho)-2-C-methyl-D-erythritol kinase [Candidatus Electrothrix aestuarii]|uniref:4-diphosphocytidyl-2-C-methyl-D-erythritol kinase n=1 Tax=Candidatus Electrothrix aestuarii TaxID=3062594 RepID=A0AAU8LW94_9BACT|nr:4-(cytidine 5'-diphospho)-2-C-methyl-D-erythritol kinase [Candidatus Electrothrix aestuarii]
MTQQTTPLKLRAPAKINLTLKILGKREDGYHELETLMQKVSLFDELELSLTSDPGITIHCSNYSNADLPEDKDNIAVRAAQLFLQETNNSSQGVNIVLKKNIPIAAGLGGGSSNAAAVINGLDQLMNTNCPAEQRVEMGVRIGADVPLFVYDFPAALARGIGERLLPVPSLSAFQVLLVNPGILVSTKWAFEAFSATAKRITLTAEKKTFTLPCSKNCRQKIASDKGQSQDFIFPDDLHNDLELVTAERHPIIQNLKDRLLTNGAAGAMMSGSGSTVFGLFHETAKDQAEQCHSLLQQEYDQVYLVSPLEGKQ